MMYYKDMETTVYIFQQTRFSNSKGIAYLR